MRIFKTKLFARQARREGLTDRSLTEAVDAADKGSIDADLRGGVIKQRVARSGSGKSGGYRAILAYHSEVRSVFMYLFAKNDRENITDNELISLRDIARSWLHADDKSIGKGLSEGKIVEVKREKSAGKKSRG